MAESRRTSSYVRKSQQSSVDAIMSIKERIASMKEAVASGTSSTRKIVDIMTFLTDPFYLNIQTATDIQRIILKVFYRKSEYNEKISLTKEEINIVKKANLTNVDNGNVLDKYNSGNVFRELVLVWGRRAGKDFIISIIAAYEAYKLLEVPGGDAYSYYNVARSSPMNILTIANSKSQAKIAFNEIKSKILLSPYFKDKFNKECVLANELKLMTPDDKRLNKELGGSDSVLALEPTVCIRVGHSNTDSLVGIGCFVLILDEVGLYKNTGGSSSADMIYNKLTPTMTSYYRIEKQKLPDGTIQDVTVYDSKTISISSPRGKDGKLYDLFITADSDSKRLACRLPTWIVNPQKSRASLREEFLKMTEEEFEMEIGAQFSGTSSEKFFIEDKVKNCFKSYYKYNLTGKPGYSYFIHLDPANRHDNYAMCIAHQEWYINETTKKPDYKIVVDYLKYWHPTLHSPVLSEEVDNYIISLKSRYNIALISYDIWNSVDSINRLTKNALPHKRVHYSSRYKQIIYSELGSLVNAGKIIIPDEDDASELLKSEMIALQKKMTQKGFAVFPPKIGDGVKTDDMVDALAGCCYNLKVSETTSLPRSVLADTSFLNSSSKRMWNSMQGVPYGYGTGQSVSNALCNRDNFGRFS